MGFWFWSNASNIYDGIKWGSVVYDWNKNDNLDNFKGIYRDYEWV
jgi:hypothetical protein